MALTAILGACAVQKPTSTQVSTAIVKPHGKVQAVPTTSYLPPSLLPGQWTVDDILQTYGAFVAGKFNYYFAKAKVAYPPREVIFIALKQEKKLELWARDSGEFRLIRDYYILAASGGAGPKLRQGDRQVPEGIYRIEELNPNSHYHLSMKLNYPNNFDRFHAGQEGRTNPGSDIFIHGKTASIGCLALGDESIEELFVLTAQVGIENVKVVIAPHDPRISPLETEFDNFPDWISELYWAISREIAALSLGVASVKTGL